MLKGYYSLTSAMLTQSKNLNVISNNMVNASTPGFKKDIATISTFKDVLLQRIGNTDKSKSTPLGESSMITIIDDVVTDYTQGGLKETFRPFDVAIAGNGFFNINTDDGTVYTRNGSFSPDDEGFLTLQHVGRVQGRYGDILLNTDEFNITEKGDIIVDGVYRDTIKLTDFTDKGILEKVGEGMFSNPEANNAIENIDQLMKWQSTENSNASANEEMVAMLGSQRALQSASQMLKMYDQLMGKMVNEIGRI